MLNPLVERALQIAERRKRILADMCQAIRRGDKDTVFDLAKKLTGLTDEQKCHRIDPRLN